VSLLSSNALLSQPYLEVLDMSPTSVTLKMALVSLQVRLLCCSVFCFLRSFLSIARSLVSHLELFEPSKCFEGKEAITMVDGSICGC
jgi:hypothetical protein